MSDGSEELERPSEMRERGNITEGNFEKLKAELLAEMPDASRSTRTEPRREVSAMEPETVKIPGETRWWLVGAGVVIAVEGLSLTNLVGFAAPGIEGQGGGFVLIMAIAVIILLCGVVVALIGVFNRASLATGIGTIAAAGLSLLGVVVAIFQADEVGSLLLLTGLASLVAGLKGFDVVRQVRTQIN